MIHPKSLRVLLLEDNPLDAELVLRALRTGGLDAETVVVGNKVELTRRLAEPFDVVVADYRLPGMDLFAVLQETRERLPDVPFVVISGSTTEEQLLAAIRLGADDYLLKDRLSRLATAVTRAVEKRRLQQERAQAQAMVRQQEEALRHLQRVESIGRLAGGILHDFNNLITVVLGSTELALQTLPLTHDAAPLLQQVLAAGGRAAQLTHQLLAFSRRQTIPVQSLDLDDVVQTFLPLARQMLGAGIEVEVRLAHDLPRLRGDRVQFEQVLMNLLVNARDAMPHGGAITLATRLLAAAPTGSGLAAGPCVELLVRDNGTGMTESVQQRIFEPYFTTKPEGTGTGLGLSTTLAIVQQAGGAVQVESTLGHGTEFRVLLPAPQPVPAHAPPPAIVAAAAKQPTILLLDDEPMVRTMLQSVLGSAGYAVLSAANVDDAHLLSRHSPQPIDLLVADAEAAADAALRQRLQLPPDLPLLLLGQPDHTQAQREQQPFLEKPFSPKELLAEIHRAMHARR